MRLLPLAFHGGDLSLWEWLGLAFWATVFLIPCAAFVFTLGFIINSLRKFFIERD